MLVIIGNKKINFMLKKYLDKQKIKVLNTVSPEYLIVNLDNIEELRIPAELKTKIKIKKIELSESMSGILEDSVYLKTLINKTNGILTVGDFVKVTKGNYKGLTGCIKEINKINYKVEFDIFGQKVTDYFAIEEIEKYNE